MGMMKRVHFDNVVQLFPPRPAASGTPAWWWMDWHAERWEGARGRLDWKPISTYEVLAPAWRWRRLMSSVMATAGPMARSSIGFGRGLPRVGVTRSMTSSLANGPMGIWTKRSDSVRTKAEGGAYLQPVSPVAIEGGVYRRVQGQGSLAARGRQGLRLAGQVRLCRARVRRCARTRRHELGFSLPGQACHQCPQLQFALLALGTGQSGAALPGAFHRLSGMVGGA